MSVSYPKFTVVIPVYNGENYLRETLNSLLAQSYPAAEILLINDGSTDTTAGIGASFGDRIRLINRENTGVGPTRNYGISIARHEWVAILDHDDLWEAGHLENLARAIANQPDADLCFSGGCRYVLDPASGIFHRAEPLKVPPIEDIHKVLLDHAPFIASAVAFKKSTVMAIGGYDSHFIICQNWDLWLRLSHHGAKFIYSPEPTVLYRVHPASATNNPLRGLRYARELIEQDILPRLSLFGRLTHGRRILSRLEGEAAILLRENGIAGALGMMMLSIIRYPFHEPRRYKIATHMLFHGYPRSPSAT